MAAPVPPVVRGEFVYRDTFFVDVGGEGKRHARASEPELKQLLDGKAAKDQVGHWYEAQLIHYGLQRSKEKNTAKVRLQQALSQGKLGVPAHIVDMEVQMKKEYASAVRRARAQAKSTVDGEAVLSKVKKRKPEENVVGSLKKTKLAPNVNGLSINVEHDVQTPAENMTKKTTQTYQGKDQTTKSTAATKKAGKAVEGTQNDKPKGKQKKALEADLPETSAKMKKQLETPAKQRKDNIRADVTPKSGSAKGPKPKAENTDTPKANAKAETKLEAKARKESSIKPAKAVKRDAQVKHESEPNPMDTDGFNQQQLGTRNVTGVYNLSCPQLEEQLPDMANNLRLFLCVDNGMIWGGFELAMKSGVIRVDEVEIDRTVSFGWRARDSWENERLTFGRGCFGEFRLYGRDRVRGIFENLLNEPMVFDGQRRPGPLWCGRSAHSFQSEWDSFVSETYGR